MNSRKRRSENAEFEEPLAGLSFTILPPIQFRMGHIVKEGQEKNYRPKDVEFHRKLYAKKAMLYLRLETVTLTETDRIIQRQAQGIEDLQETLAILKADRETDQKRLEEECRVARDSGETTQKQSNFRFHSKLAKQ